MQDATVAFLVLWVLAWGIGFAFLPSYRRHKKRADRPGLRFGPARAKGIWLWVNSVGTLALGTCFLGGSVVCGVQDWIRHRRQERMESLAVRCEPSPGSISIANQGGRTERIRPAAAYEIEWPPGLLTEPSRYRLHLVDPRAIDLAPGQAVRFEVSDGPLCSDDDENGARVISIAWPGHRTRCEVELRLCFLDAGGDEDFCGRARCSF
ncbi:MAG: hypothetical protein JXR96_03920 [Deltaproteobacteria bacterium]|nr:hypothetical protein [Deltaproteobacteria bacterium]